MNIEIYFDGACNNHQEERPMGVGVAILIDTIYDEELSRAIGLREGWQGDRSTSNVAEWIGCVEAFKAASALRQMYPGAQMQVFSDSQIITYCFNGTYKIRERSFVKYKIAASKLAEGLKIGPVKWIPREKNKLADKLSKEGLKLIAC